MLALAPPTSGSDMLSGLDSRDVEMRRCRTAGRVDDRASDSLPTRPKGNGPCREGRERESSLSGRARDRKQKY